MNKLTPSIVGLVLSSILLFVALVSPSVTEPKSYLFDSISLFVTQLPRAIVIVLAVGWALYPLNKILSYFALKE